jgi:methionine synthase II (cobalamin-independent)
MSKSTLSIILDSSLPTYLQRTIGVPCRLPEAFNFRLSGRTYTATVYASEGMADACIDLVEFDGAEAPNAPEFDAAEFAAKGVLATIKATLGITGPVPPGSPLPAIALAYESEVAAYEACVKAHRNLPPALHSMGITISHPDDPSAYGYVSRATKMLAKYVEYVVEQACKAQTERAEPKVTP